MNCIIHGVAQSRTRLSDFHYVRTDQPEASLKYSQGTRGGSSHTRKDRRARWKEGKKDSLLRKDPANEKTRALCFLEPFPTVHSQRLGCQLLKNSGPGGNISGGPRITRGELTSH